jgi:membrane protease YdiL (CAAX protease family)
LSQNSPVFLRVLCFLGILLLVTLPISLPLRLWLGQSSELGLGIFLYVAFVIEVGWWGRRVWGQSAPYGYYGLTVKSPSGREFLWGLAIALVSFSALMLLQVGLGWLVVREADLIPAILSGALTAFGVGFAEELLFRGWLLTELERDLDPTAALWANSLIFAVLHFIKPLEVIWQTWVQFPGLVLLGMILVWARRLTAGRLSMAIALHSGLVWAYYIVNTTQWIVPNGTAPEWLTGIGGNPLAGLMGLAFLGGMGFMVRSQLSTGGRGT